MDLILMNTKLLFSANSHYGSEMIKFKNHVWNHNDSIFEFRALNAK